MNGDRPWHKWEGRQENVKNIPTEGVEERNYDESAGGKEK